MLCFKRKVLFLVYKTEKLKKSCIWALNFLHPKVVTFVIFGLYFALVSVSFKGKSTTSRKIQSFIIFIAILIIKELKKAKKNDYSAEL